VGDIQWETRFPEPCAYMRMEGKMVISHPCF
jgi:hypothetical protein